MLEKELAWANPIANKAQHRAWYVRKKLVAEPEELHAIAKRDLSVACKNWVAANACFTVVRAGLEAGVGTDKKQKVEAVTKSRFRS
jgi:hypothetical protein